jgi:hypothetical protein
LTVLPEEPPRQTLRVENCDLSVLLTEFHALAGDYMRELSTNLQRMGPNRNYILAVNDYICELFPVEWYFHTDDYVKRVIPDIANSDNLQIFIVNTEESKFGHIFGSIAEIPLAKLRELIEKHSFSAINIEIERRDGTEYTVTPQEWARIGEAEREEFNSWVVHYNPDDENNLDYLISATRYVSDETVFPNEFLTRLNALSLNPIEPQSDKLWIDRRAAKNLTASGDITVYRLSANGCESLSPIDTIKPDFITPATRGFAINGSDLPKLDIWANGEIRKAMRTIINRDRDRGEAIL